MKEGLRLLAGGVIALLIVSPAGAAYPAGATNAVLSFIDVAGSHVSVNRHWPSNPQDVQVAPFAPQFWNSCLPGDGAIMMLVTGPGYAPPVGISAEQYNSQYLARLAQAVTTPLAQSAQVHGSPQLLQMIAAMTIPGNPLYEQLKEIVFTVDDLSHYESYGYAVFLFIKWEWRWPFPGCYPTYQVVPEGYGIPFVS